MNLIALLLTAAAVYLAGNAAAPLIDRDEPRYAQCSREMLHGSPEYPGPDWIVPRMQGEVRTAKPPLIYWCQAGVMAVIDDTAFAARLPSVIAAVLTLLLWATAVRRMAGPRRATWSAFILATSMLFTLTAKWCTTDAVLLLFVTAAQVCVYAMLHARAGWRTTLALGAAIGLAGLTKGPVVLGVIGMTLLVLRVMRWWDGRLAATEVADALRSSSGSDRPNTSATSVAVFKVLAVVLVVAAICGPWLWMIHQREPGFLPRILGHDVIRRSTGSLEGHGAPPGYHLLTIWATYFPWSILLPAAVAYAWRRRGAPVIRFALATVIGTWLMFEIVWTKLPHYLLPLFPWLSLLTADAVVRLKLPRRAMVAWAAIPTGIALMPWLATGKFDVPVAPTVIVTAVGVVITVATAALFLRNRPCAGLLAMGGGCWLLVAVLFGVYLPRADFLRASVLAGEELRRLGVEHVQMLGYKEPSLAFYQGGTIRENSAMRLGRRVVEVGPEYLVISDRVWENSTPEERQRYEVLKTYPALNYSSGMRVQRVMIVRRLAPRLRGG